MNKHYIIKGDGYIDNLLGLCPKDDLPFCNPVDSYARPAHRTTHLIELTALDIKEKHNGSLTKIQVGDIISIGQFMGDVLPTFSVLTDVDVSVAGEPGLELKLVFTNGFEPVAEYVDRERRTVPTDGSDAVCELDMGGDLESIKGSTPGYTGEHLIARFDDMLPENRVLHATRAGFEVVALPVAPAGHPAGTPPQLRGNLKLQLRMNFIDRSYCDKMRSCSCKDARVDPEGEEAPEAEGEAPAAE